MTQVKRPTLKKYPKRPSASATLEAWKRYDARCTETEKENKARMAEYGKKLAFANKAKKVKEILIKRTSTLKGVAFPRTKPKPKSRKRAITKLKAKPKPRIKYTTKAKPKPKPRKRYY